MGQDIIEFQSMYITVLQEYRQHNSQKHLEGLCHSHRCCIPDKEIPAILLLLNAWMVEAHYGANSCDSLSLLLFIWLTLCSY